MNSNDIKRALQIKRKKKAAEVRGSINHRASEAVKLHKDTNIHDHAKKGGVHAQNSKGFKNVHIKGV